MFRLSSKYFPNFFALILLVLTAAIVLVALELIVVALALVAVVALVSF